MRTTLTLDPDVALLIEEAMHRERTTMKAVVNDAIRRGLGPSVAREPAVAYVVEPHETALRPGVDAGRLNQLTDELADDEILGR